MREILDEAKCDGALLTYYTYHFLYNIVLLVIYIYQVYIDHAMCLTKSGADIGDSFDFAFLSGFIVISADILNSDCFGYYFRCKVSREIKLYDTPTWRSETI